VFAAVRQTTLALLGAATITTSLWLVPAEAAAPSARYASTAFSTTNHARVVRDRARLRTDSCLQRYAVRWAQQMARTKRLEHQSLGPIMRRCHLNAAGENIAYGFPTGRAVVNRGWMRSAGHRENILRPQFRRMGIGAAKDSRGNWWVSQVFGRKS
jgi:uncharacterized protein YkwD